MSCNCLSTSAGKGSICIQARQVIAACRRDIKKENFALEFTLDRSVNPNCPLCLSCVHTAAAPAEISDLSVCPLCDRPGFARVRGNVTFNLEAELCADNCPVCGVATVSLPVDLILQVPCNTMLPYMIEAWAAGVVSNATWMCGTCFEVTLCASIVVQVLADTMVSLPGASTCQVNACETYADSVCDDFFSMPLFPTGSVASGSACANGGNSNSSCGCGNNSSCGCGNNSSCGCGSNSSCGCGGNSSCGCGNSSCGCGNNSCGCGHNHGGIQPRSTTSQAICGTCGAHPCRCSSGRIVRRIPFYGSAE